MAIPLSTAALETDLVILDRAPYMKLDADDRTGASPEWGKTHTPVLPLGSHWKRIAPTSYLAKVQSSMGLPHRWQCGNTVFLINPKLRCA